jgi:hypothetical protein
MLGRKRIGKVVLALFLTAVVVAAVFNYFKLRSLGFHTRDFAFYLEFAAKLLDPALSNRYSLNPVGYNFLGCPGVDFPGTEGTGNFHQAIHFEPMKYIYAVVYRLSRGPMGIIVLTALVCFFPIVYLAFSRPLDQSLDRWFVILFAILYIVYPSSFLAVSYDLRPYVFLAPFFALSILSLQFRRPLWETVVFFTLMFFSREEAIVLGLVVVIYATLNSVGARKGWISAIVLAFLWLTWFGLMYAYFSWKGCVLDWKLALPQLDLNTLILPSIVGVIVLAFFAWLFVRVKLPVWRVFQVVLYSVVFVPLGWQLVSMEKAGTFTFSAAQDLVVSPRLVLYFTVMMVLIAILWDLISLRIFRKGVLVLLAFGILFSLVACSLMPDLTAPGLLLSYIERKPLADLVFSLRDATNREETYILCDYATYQAFYDYENLYVYSRLPWYLAPGDVRYYPINVPILQDLLSERVEYIVITKKSESNIDDLLVSASLEPVEVQDNGQYKIIRLR